MWAWLAKLYHTDVRANSRGPRAKKGGAFDVKRKQGRSIYNRRLVPLKSEQEREETK